MDPASAIGVAAATVQFFAIGIKAIRLGRQICASETGTTEAYEALEVSLKAISEIRKDLRPGLVHGVDSNIVKAQKQCMEISEKLLRVLEGIKASSQTAKSKFLKDVTATWQVMRSRSKIDKLEQELRVAQNHFKQALTVETRNAIAQVLENQGKDTGLLQSLWDEIQNLRPELQQSRKENSAAHGQTHSSIARIEQTSVAQHAVIQSSHQATLGALEGLDTQFNNMRVTDVHRDFLETLRYPDMLSRQQEISPPATGTYEWVFTGESPYQDNPHCDKDFLSADLARRQQLLHWFSTEESLFWVNGKPGSGKSSLMSFIVNDERTLQSLQIWAGQTSVRVIKFFFWRPGSPLQRSVPGMLRSLLYQLLMIDTSVIDRLFAEKSTKRHPTWEQTELLRTLETVLRLQNKEHICFFIDGLDEHDGDYMALLDLILRTQVTSNIKICLSSRPEPVFRLRLSACPSISMQDLNGIDIGKLVHQKLSPLGTTSSNLIEEVIRRAEGIMLWAALVCSSLLRGYTMHDDEVMLRQRLDETPSGLKDLFRHMFSKIDKIHRDYLRAYCHLLKWASGTNHKTFLTSLSLVTAVTQSVDCSSPDAFIKMCASCEHRVVAQSQGLIEVGIRDSERNSSEKGLWALQNVADQGVLRSRNHPCSEDLFNYSRLHIRWVHRSAHDCIFGETGETVAPWIIIVDDHEFRRKAVASLRWLAKHSPTISTEFAAWENEFLGRRLHITLDSLVLDIFSLTTHDEWYQIVEELHDLITSALFGQNRRSCRREWQAFRLFEHTVSIELKPLVDLWYIALDTEQSSCVDRLEKMSFAAVVCGGLLSSRGALKGEALRCRLLDCVWRSIQPWDAGENVSGGFLHNRQFGFRERSKYVQRGREYKNRIILSWLGSGDRDEADIVHALAVFLGPSVSFPSDQSWPRVSAMLEARDVWRGPSGVDDFQNLLPLQFLLPNRAFLQWWASSRTKVPSSPADVPSRLRLVCLHRSERTPVSSTLQQQLVFEPKMVAMFDLSATVTASMLSQRTKWTSVQTEHQLISANRLFEMSWIGKREEYSACLQDILDDIWQNCGQQLDAWQQLYALACVKFCFRRMWRID